MKGATKKIALSIAALFLVLTCGFVGALSADDFQTGATALPKFGKVQEFVLHDQDGKEFGSAQLKGSVWVVNFFFSRCGMICPVVNAKVNNLQKQFAGQKGLHFVSISVDPEHDTVEVLANYRKRYSEWTQIWHFLTGDEQIISALSQQAFKFDALGQPDQHSTRFVLVDKQGSIRGYYASEDQAAIAKLKVDIDLLLKS